MEEAVNYYLHRINSFKKTGYMFGFMPFPDGSPVLFTTVNVVLFALIASYIGSPVLLFIPLFIISWEHYLLSYKRNVLFDDCMASEAFMQNEFKENGIDPNFPQDPLYVTKSDREEIFDECVDLIDNSGFLSKLKSHQAFVILLMASYTVIYFLLRLWVI